MWHSSKHVSRVGVHPDKDNLVCYTAPKITIQHVSFSLSVSGCIGGHKTPVPHGLDVMIFR